MSALDSNEQVKVKAGSCCFPPAELPVRMWVHSHPCVRSTACITLFTSSGVTVGVFLVNAGLLLMIWVLPLYFCVYKSVAHGACGETAEEQQQLIILKFTQHLSTNTVHLQMFSPNKKEMNFKCSFDTEKPRHLLPSLPRSPAPYSLIWGKMLYSSLWSRWLTVHDLQRWMINGKKAQFIHRPAYLSAAHWYCCWKCGEKHSWM